MLRLLLLLIHIVISINVDDPQEVFVADCNGGFHVRKVGVPLLSEGFDASFFKRLLDEALAIYQEQVKCRCPTITQTQLDDNFRPGLKAFLSAWEGNKGSKTGYCGGKEANGIPYHLGKIFDWNTTEGPPVKMPSTFSLAHWLKEGRVSFKWSPQFDVLGDEGKKITDYYGRDFQIYFAATNCSGKVGTGTPWFHVSVSLSGSLINYYSKVCTSKDQCGHLNCTDIYNPTALNREDLLFQSSIPKDIEPMLSGADWYKGETCTKNGQNAYENFADSWLTFLLNNLTPSGGTKKHSFSNKVSLCGGDLMNDGKSFVADNVPNVMGDSERHRYIMNRVIESSNRHRDTLKRLVKRVRTFPVLKHVKDIVNKVSTFDLKDMAGFMKTAKTMASEKLETVSVYASRLRRARSSSRRLLEEEGGFEDLFNSTYLKSWNTSAHQSMFTPDRLSGRYYGHFLLTEDTKTRVNIMSSNGCTKYPLFNFMAGSHKGARLYLPDYIKVITHLYDSIRELINCRTSLKPLTFEQFNSRFMVLDALFPMRFIMNRSKTQPMPNLGPAGYDTFTKIYEATLNGSFSVLTPETCNFETFYKDGKCSFEYDNLESLLNFKVKIVVDIRRCKNKPTAFTWTVDCVGDDCQMMFNPFSQPCNPANEATACKPNKCSIFKVCNPFGFITGNKTLDNYFNTPDKFDKCVENDQCEKLSTFQERLVKAALNVGSPKSTAQTAQMTGMCEAAIFTSINVDAKKAENWFKEAFETKEHDLGGGEKTQVLHVKNLKSNNGSSWNKADGTTPSPPTTKSPTKSPTTKKPTMKGETWAPTGSPTWYPTTRKPTMRGETWAPTSLRPTKSPTKSPTAIFDSSSYMIAPSYLSVLLLCISYLAL